MAEAPLKLQVILIQTGDKIWTLGKRLLSKHENRVRKKIALLGRAHTVPRTLQVFTNLQHKIYHNCQIANCSFICLLLQFIVLNCKDPRNFRLQNESSPQTELALQVSEAAVRI